MTDFTDEQALLDRLRKVEALFSRTDIAGERDAAAQAMAGILEQLRRIERTDPPVEYSLSSMTNGRSGSLRPFCAATASGHTATAASATPP